ncbi:phosphatase PAP2 family protein [Halalkalicoccus subterraneus]|uniref:phosphatase PAP2 family protein n=1 Tax=Halalkalicoccus subterraneus TaxID=2675002 RepID=UPI000EFCA687|nr:phosphatase PAP2 family protein [Halalkalicoccus subterraneus]
MALPTVLLSVVAVVSLLLAFTTAVCISRQQLRELVADLRPRLGLAAPGLALLIAVLIVNSLTRRAAQQLSWLFGFQITDRIYRLEGDFVAWIQTFQTAELTIYFSAIYVYGYVFLLVFPLLAYLALSEQRPLHEITIAYTANYAIGLVCYLLFVAYGPRNLDVAQQLMYNVYPSSRLLTSAVNTNTNVFPSLHTSLSMTVLLFAWRTRDAYPRWLAIAAVVAVSIVLSTMYLGIHWLTDVTAGTGLAVLSYWLGVRGADRWRDFATRAAPRITGAFRSRL